VTGHGLNGRRVARRMIAIAIALDAVVAWLLLQAPRGTGGGWSAPPSVVLWLVPLIGVVTNVIGLVWMIRIYRADPEARPSSWRSQR